MREADRRFATRGSPGLLHIAADLAAVLNVTFHAVVVIDNLGPQFAILVGRAKDACTLVCWSGQCDGFGCGRCSIGRSSSGPAGAPPILRPLRLELPSHTGRFAGPSAG